MNLTSDLLAEIDSFLAESGMAASTFGQRAVRDWRFVERLRDGRVTVSLVERAQSYMADWRQRKAAAADAVAPAPGQVPSAEGPLTEDLTVETEGEAA